MFYAHTNVLKQQKITRFSSVSIGAIFVSKLSFTDCYVYVQCYIQHIFYVKFELLKTDKKKKLKLKLKTFWSSQNVLVFQFSKLVKCLFQFSIITIKYPEESKKAKNQFQPSAACMCTCVFCAVLKTVNEYCVTKCVCLFHYFVEDESMEARRIDIFIICFCLDCC